MNQKGFTLIETIIAIAIFALITGVSAAGISRMTKTVTVSPADSGIIHGLSTAARRARNAESQSGWGIYLPYDETTRTSTEIILYKGDSYLTRDVSADLPFPISESVKFTTVNLSGAGVSSGDDHEVNFEMLSGETTEYGTITLTIFGEERTIEVNAEGFTTKEL